MPIDKNRNDPPDEHDMRPEYELRGGVRGKYYGRYTQEANIVRPDAAAPSREARIQAALAVCGKHGDPRGETNVAGNHDRHLDEAYKS